MTANLQTVWRRSLPEFSIRHLRGTSTSRGYHENYYEVISDRPLDADDFTRLDACDLLGMGQAYRVKDLGTFEKEEPPVAIDGSTGEVVPGAVPKNYRGEPITNTTSYTWHRYEVLRICDSGD